MNLVFETTTNCNAKCITCPMYETTRPKGHMSDALFHKLIKEGKEFGINYYLPYMNGEYFTSPKAYERLDYMEKEGVKVWLFTNAELIDVDRLVKYKCIRWINCSLNATTKETYDKIMRKPDFKKVKKNTRDLIKKAKFKVTVSMVLNKLNAKEADSFKKIWGNRASIFNYVNYGGARESYLEKDKPVRHCRKVVYNIPVLWDGMVNLCCFDYDGKMIFGDLNKESLRDIYKKRQDIRKRHRNGDFSMSPCNKCNYNYVKI